MANITPTLEGTAGTPVRDKGVYSNILAANTEVVSTVNNLIADKSNLMFSVYHFSAVADTDQWNGSSTDPPPRKPIAVAFQGDDVDDDIVNAYILQVGGDTTDSIIEFQTSGGGGTGWIWVLHQR